MSALQTAAIYGTGAYVPEKILANDDFARVYKLDTGDEWITTRTGIKRRRMAAENQATSDLCLSASRAAIDTAGLQVSDLDMLIVGTITPDYPFPSAACVLQDKLGLSYLFISHNLAVVRHMANRIAVMYLGRIVEHAPTDELFEAPRHPYTRALIDALPDLSMSGRARRVIEGEIPNPIQPPPGTLLSASGTSNMYPANVDSSIKGAPGSSTSATRSRGSNCPRL